MKTDLEYILKKYSQTENYYENSNANSIFFQLYSKNHDNLIEIIDSLLAHNLIVDHWLLYRLSKDLRINELEYLSNKGFEVNKIDDNGENILFKIFEQTDFNYNEETFQSFKDIFERIVKLEADYKLINTLGRNLIHQAIVYGADNTLLKYIVSFEIDINKQDNDGFTPLHLLAKSCSYYTLNLIEILLNNGASASKYLKAVQYNYGTTDIPLPIGLTPLELFEIEKTTFTEYYQYDKEIMEKLK